MVRKPRMQDVFSASNFQVGDIVYARPVENGEADWDPSEKFRIRHIVGQGVAVIELISTGEIIPDEIPFRNLKKVN